MPRFDKDTYLRWQFIAGIAVGFLGMMPLIASVVMLLLYFGVGGEQQKQAPNPPEVVFGFPAAAIVLCGSSVALFVWSYRLNHRADIEPDILSDLVPEENRFMQERVQFGVQTLMGPTATRLVVLIQNRFSGPTKFRLEFLREGGSDLVWESIPTLNVILEDSAVTAAYLDVFALPQCHGLLKLRLSVSARRAGKRGREVRFRYGKGVSGRISPGVTAAAAVTGTLLFGGGTYLNVPLDNPTAATGAPPTWQAMSLWTLAARTEMSDIQAFLEANVFDSVI